MLRACFVFLAVAAAASSVGCEKSDKGKAAVALPPSADGTRRVAIEVNKEGYNPDRIAGKPGEKLGLVFTRTFEADCISQVKSPDGKLIELPMNKPVEVAVTVPQTGEIGFACGMDMFHGVVVAQP
jgi:plastocyanin domain-containing protein